MCENWDSLQIIAASPSGLPQPLALMGICFLLLLRAEIPLLMLNPMTKS